MAKRQDPNLNMHRIGFFLFGVFFLSVVTSAVHFGFEIPLTQAFAAVLGVTTVQMILLGVLAVRFISSKEGERRFTIGTMLIVSSYLAVFFAIGRVIVQQMRLQEVTFGWSESTILAVTGVMLTVISTVVCLGLADSLVAAAYWTLRTIRQTRSEKR